MIGPTKSLEHNRSLDNPYPKVRLCFRYVWRVSIRRRDCRANVVNTSGVGRLCEAVVEGNPLNVPLVGRGMCGLWQCSQSLSG